MVRFGVYLCPVPIAVAIVVGLAIGWASTGAIVAYAVLALLVAALIAYWQLMKHSDSIYQAAIAAKLDEAFSGPSLLEESRSADKLKLVVLSDQHKGTRDGADDFWRCERAYRAALAYYHEIGYRLIVLGDAEELWECHAPDVLREYKEVLALEQRFHADGRYERTWDNHDLDWSQQDKVEEHLVDVFGPDLVVREGLKLIYLGQTGNSERCF